MSEVRYPHRTRESAHIEINQMTSKLIVRPVEKRVQLLDLLLL